MTGKCDISLEKAQASDSCDSGDGETGAPDKCQHEALDECQIGAAAAENAEGHTAAASDGHENDGNRQHPQLQRGKVAGEPLQDAIDLVTLDRAYRAARKHLYHIEQALTTNEQAIDKLRADVAEHQRASPERNADLIERLEQRIRVHEDSLSHNMRELADARAAQEDERMRWDRALSRFTEPFLDETDANVFGASPLSDTVLEALTKAIEVDAQHEAEHGRRADLDAKYWAFRARMRTIAEPLNPDAPGDEEQRQSAERTLAPMLGKLHAMERRCELYDHYLVELEWERNEAYEDLYTALDKMLVEAGLLGPNTTDPSSEESNSVLDEAYNDDGTPTPAQNLRENKRQAKANLALARKEFELLGERYDEHLFMFHTYKRPGENVSDFDRDYFVGRRDLTKRIIFNEKQLESAKRGMQEGGLPPSDTAESGFVDRSDDGGPMTSREVGAPVDRGRVEAWLEGVAAGDKYVGRQEWPSDMQDSELDRTQRNALVDVNDSVSCVATGKDERRLREWVGRRSG